MSDDTTITGFDEMEASDDTLLRTYTQVVSCVVGKRRVERRRQRLRAKLESEQHEREKEIENSFITTLSNLFKVG